MNKESTRKLAEQKVNEVYGLGDPSVEDVKQMVEKSFGSSPIVQFPGFRQQHPLFGCHQGASNLNAHFQLFYDTIEVKNLKKQFVVVDGFSAAAHYEAEFRFKEIGSTYLLEFVALVEPDIDGRLRTLKLFFDTATFLKAANGGNKTFTDVRGIDAHPEFNPDSRPCAGAVMSGFYDTFLQCYLGNEPWEALYNEMAEGVEVVFKSDVAVIPYAGQHSGKAGFKQWFKDLFSIWSLCSFNYTRIVAEGNVADFEIHELHYYDNPDGSKRYLDVYIIQSWLVDEDGKLHRFKSYHDSAWLVETYRASETYLAHYGYPKGYLLSQ
jgi:hypothetical protein